MGELMGNNVGIKRHDVGEAGKEDGAVTIDSTNNEQEMALREQGISMEE